MDMVTSLGQYGLQRSAAKQVKYEGEIAAQQEELAATQREADRKSRLADALASQNAMAAARGVAAFEGSPLTVMQEDMRKEEVATQRDEFQTKLAAMTSRARGKIQSRMLKTQANIGLLSDISEKAKSAGG